MSKQRIAIIEDDQIISQMYQMKFASEDFEVQVASNGKLGIDLVHQMQPDIVLLDVRMPVMDGPTALAHIRQQEWGKEVPVLVLTNAGEESLAHEMEILNIEAFITKASLTPSQVVTRVKEVLNRIAKT